MVDHGKIKKLRDGKGLSQAAAAKLAGFTSRQRWSDVERGRRDTITVDSLERVAKALGVKARELLK